MNRTRLSPSYRYQPLRALQHAHVDHFRESCFIPEIPAVIPQSYVRDLPAFTRWFKPAACSKATRLNTEYLEQHGGNSIVPLELTYLMSEGETPRRSISGLAGTENEFQRLHAPLSMFLQWMRGAETESQQARLYLAQCKLLDLPQILRDDFPPPELVVHAGKGDIYDTNIWIGHPPTYTPLHRDPNPNLFIQLAGRKVVRLLSPEDGLALFSSARRQIGKSGDRGAAAFRGDEMMQGEERKLLEQAVWAGEGSSQADIALGEGYEARLDAGDGIFIPKGWWHSIKGIGEGVTASVNWWFR